MTGLTTSSFQWLDYVVFSAVLLISLSIGIYSALSGEKQRTTSEYLLANRNLKWLPVGVSILVTFQSAVLYLGVPAEIYTYGTSYLLFHIGMAMAVFITTVVFVPLLYPLKLTSVFEYLERRYHSKVARIIGSILGSLNMILYMGVVTFASSAALEAVSGFPTWAGILLVISVATFYTTLASHIIQSNPFMSTIYPGIWPKLIVHIAHQVVPWYLGGGLYTFGFKGGLRGVIWTDVFQFLIMMSGLLAILIQGFVTQGGFVAVWQRNEEGKRIDFSSFSPDPRVRHTVWSLLIGGTFTWLANISVNQSNVQRFSSVPNLNAAKWAVLTSLPGFVVLGCLASFVGMIVYAYFSSINCDPLESGIIKSPNQLVPLYIVKVFDFLPGFSGLFVAALLSAAFSTVSSSINGLAAMAWEDMLKWKLHYLSEKYATIIVKISAAFYGLLGMLIAYIASVFGGPATQIVLSFFGASGGPLIGMFLLGSIFPAANWIGTSVGAIVAVSFCMWIAIGSKSLPPVKTMPTISVSGCFNTSLQTTTSVPNTSFMTSFYEHSTVQPIYNELSGLYRISYLWYSTIGICIVIVVGLMVSLLTGRSKYEDTDSELLLPCVNRFYKLYFKKPQNNGQTVYEDNKTTPSVSNQALLSARDNNSAVIVTSL